MKRHIGVWWMWSVLAVMLTGCRDFEADAILSEHVRVPVAYAFSSAMAGGQTRQGSDALVGDEREVTILSIIPTKDGMPDGSEVSQPEEPVSKTDPKAKFYHYQFCNMTTGVNRCLVYGKAADATVPSETNAKAYNGNLTLSNLPIQTVPYGYNLNNISFGLESIYDVRDGNGAPVVPEDASTLAQALTDLADVKVDNDNYWKNSQNAVLSNLFKNFTNHGFNLPGSAASVKQWVLALRDAAQSYLTTPPSTIGETETTILTAIKDYVTDERLAEITSTYPRDKGLPDGAAALRWVESESKFVPQLQTTTLDNINSVSRFAYPAALYYFVNSTLRTSDSKVNFSSVYNSSADWSSVLSTHFSDENKKSVTSNTKAVALTSPVQYAVAQLKVNLEPSAATLKDANSQDVTIGDDFPLKGIIVCGQRPVDYQFESSNSDVDVKFIYDPLVEDVYLSTTEQTDVATTLVLQSLDGDDVDIILEFENNSSQAFKCVDGTVYPGTRFYLIGQVKATGGTGGDSTSSGRVFTKDYTTTVNMTVTSLAKAYNVLPNLLTSNLEIGVETVPQWIAATPTTIRLDDIKDDASTDD